ncbi:hypothetical protein E2C01_077235 [Portunus trituberculatus]|uniref:Uncharacterized protein n=1 Tax=Portunus trituberculatus TaxID=210409 RepID=A0A5B7IFB4_PORTR|nr:hypothetical protein [Portunus trituberculatus]
MPCFPRGLHSLRCRRALGKCAKCAPRISLGCSAVSASRTLILVTFVAVHRGRAHVLPERDLVKSFCLPGSVEARDVTIRERNEDEQA